jgi:16S rRNA (guanine527-N7)-methyltransferase
VERQAQLLEILGRAQSQGFLGPGDPREHLSHTLGFIETALGCLGGPPAQFADLGTGGGVPGLALALSWPQTEASLIESATRRCTALGEWITELGLESRVRVLEGRAEGWARVEGIRETFELVTARSFARPAVTAEIAAGLVRVGGFLVVSEPPESSPDRWPPAALERLGFEAAVPALVGGKHYASLRKARLAPETAPRAVGRPGKHPLW